MDNNNNKKRKNLTFGEKKEICEWKNRYPYETLENIAKKFEVSKSLELQQLLTVGQTLNESIFLGWFLLHQ